MASCDRERVVGPRGGPASERPEPVVASGGVMIKSPMQSFLDTLPLSREKMIAAA
jgi:hypothetical protein